MKHTSETCEVDKVNEEEKNSSLDMSEDDELESSSNIGGEDKSA